MADSIIANPAPAKAAFLPSEAHEALAKFYDTIQDQLAKLGEATAIISTAAAVVNDVYDNETLGNPDIYGALQAAVRILNEIHGELVPDELERMLSGEETFMAAKKKPSIRVPSTAKVSRADLDDAIYMDLIGVKAVLVTAMQALHHGGIAPNSPDEQIRISLMRGALHPVEAAMAKLRPEVAHG